MDSPDRLSRKRTRTRDHIAAVAFGLFEQHGYETVTMEQIALDAGLARATLYNHFPVKEAVLAHCLHERLARDLQSLAPGILSRPTFAARLAALLESSANWWEAHRQYAAPYIRFRFQAVRDDQADTAASDMLAAYVSLIAAAQDAGELRADRPAGQLARYLHFLYLCALMGWLEEAARPLGEELAGALAFFLEGAAG